MWIQGSWYHKWRWNDEISNSMVNRMYLQKSNIPKAGGRTVDIITSSWVVCCQKQAIKQCKKQNKELNLTPNLLGSIFVTYSMRRASKYSIIIMRYNGNYNYIQAFLVSSNIQLHRVIFIVFSIYNSLKNNFSIS